MCRSLAREVLITQAFFDAGQIFFGRLFFFGQSGTLFFDIDETALKTGMGLMAWIAVQELK